MSHSHPTADTHSLAPAYTSRLFTAPVPALRLPEESMDPEAAYRFIHDELMLDGSSRLNLATFVTTWMDPEAGKLMAETFDKNMIDKDEYPATAAIEQRCVCMVADLFHAENLSDSDPASACGVSTIGSSEAVMLGGLAMKWRWRQRVGKDWRGRTPNLVMGSNVQVVWEKFCRYFDVEPIYLPMEEGRYVITPEQVVDAVNEDTIGVVAILGTTYTGELEPVAEICAALDSLAASGGVDIPVHVDAASGGIRGAVPAPRAQMGLPAAAGGVDQRQRPQVRPDLSRYRFRGVAQLRIPARGSDLPGQLSRRRHADLHAELLPARQPGGRSVLQLPAAGPRGLYPGDAVAVGDGALARRAAVRTGEHCELISDGSAIPVVSFRLAKDRGYTEFDVSHELRGYGWQVPAYTMPENATNVSVLRIVVREGLSADLARALHDDARKALASLDKLKPGGHYDAEHFAH
ncbi:glutamate decarboxylase [Mycobacterium kiyosense]|nr:glutamate decarboxylase [Mycobacterium kiyosense]